jgi:hypothetical protein
VDTNSSGLGPLRARLGERLREPARSYFTDALCLLPINHTDSMWFLYLQTLSTAAGMYTWCVVWCTCVFVCVFTGMHLVRCLHIES